MAFSEALKADVRRKADMRCCVCHAVGVEVHHIVPISENGPDTEENAAPLCPSCHETYGANPTKRRFIREARENWFARCARECSTAGLEELVQKARDMVTKADLTAFKLELAEEVGRALARPDAPEEQRWRPLGQIIEFLYDLPVNHGAVRERDIHFMHLFVWGGSLGNEEIDEVKTKFRRTFGAATCWQLARYALRRHPNPRFTDCFSDSDLIRLVGHMNSTMLLILHHQDLAPEDFAVELAITPDGDLLANLVRSNVSPDGTYQVSRKGWDLEENAPREPGEKEEGRPRGTSPHQRDLFGS